MVHFSLLVLKDTPDPNSPIEVADFVSNLVTSLFPGEVSNNNEELDHPTSSTQFNNREMEDGVPVPGSSFEGLVPPGAYQMEGEDIENIRLGGPVSK